MVKDLRYSVIFRKRLGSTFPKKTFCISAKWFMFNCVDNIHLIQAQESTGPVVLSLSYVI